MSLALNMALTTSPVLEISAVEAYGLEAAPLVNYVDHSKKIASEYVIKSDGKKRRVYSWLTEGGKDAMYVLRNGTYNFLSPEVEGMLTHGNPQYDRLTQVAQTVTLDA